MRILFVIKSRIYSGLEHVAFDIIQNLPEGYECRYLARKGPIEDHLKRAGIDYVLVDRLTPSVIRREAGAYGADLLHANDFTASVLSPLACPHMRVISHLHSNPTWMRRRNLKSLAFRLVLPRLERVILVSDAIREEYVYASALEGKAMVLGNPFSVATVQKKAGGEPLRKAEAQKGAGEQKGCDLIYCGRLTPEKNPLGFLRVVQAYCEAYGKAGGKTDGETGGANFRAAMIGDGELRADCEAFIADHRLPVEMLGFQENPYPYIAGARVACMPSVYEGFGLVALEAMCLGRPVLASGAGGLAEIVNDSCGRICGLPDAGATELEGYTEELHKLLTDEAYYEEKSAGAGRRAAEYDNLQDYIGQIAAIYDGR